MQNLNCDHIKRLIKLTSDSIKWLSLYFLKKTFFWYPTFLGFSINCGITELINKFFDRIVTLICLDIYGIFFVIGNTIVNVGLTGLFDKTGANATKLIIKSKSFSWICICEMTHFIITTLRTIRLQQKLY